MSNRAGFTLVELLIVISIIATLAVIGFLAFSQVGKKARDGKRQSDLQSIRSALQHYFSDLSFFPTNLTFDAALTSTTGNPNPPSPVKTYFNKLPQETVSSGHSYYRYLAFPTGCDNLAASNRCNNYCLLAQVEVLGNSRNDCGSFLNPLPTNYNYGITQP